MRPSSLTTASIASYALAREPLVAPTRLLLRNASIQYVLDYTMPASAKQRAIADIYNALLAGALTALPGPWFSLEQTQAAHEAVEQGVVGNTLLETG